MWTRRLGSCRSYRRARVNSRSFRVSGEESTMDHVRVHNSCCSSSWRCTGVHLGMKLCIDVGTCTFGAQNYRLYCRSVSRNASRMPSSCPEYVRNQHGCSRTRSPKKSFHVGGQGAASACVGEKRVLTLLLYACVHRWVADNTAVMVCCFRCTESQFCWPIYSNWLASGAPISVHF